MLSAVNIWITTVYCTFMCTHDYYKHALYMYMIDHYNISTDIHTFLQYNYSVDAFLQFTYNILLVLTILSFKLF